MNYAYVRVSTNMQTVENQKIVISDYCKLRKLTRIKWVDETVSGTKDPSHRKLGSLLEVLKEGDLLIITEISRLGRSLTMIFSILDVLMKKKVRVLAIKEGFELGDNIQSQVIAFAFGLSAQLERDLISQRTKAGLERARSEGKILGRRKGDKPSSYKLDKFSNGIKRRIKSGQSINSLAKQLGCKNATLISWLERNNIKYKNRKLVRSAELTKPIRCDRVVKHC